MEIELNNLHSLPIADKLRVVEELWDGIHDSDEPLVLQHWHREETARRSAELEANPDLAITRDELWKRVDETDG